MLRFLLRNTYTKNIYLDLESLLLSLLLRKRSKMSQRTCCLIASLAGCYDGKYTLIMLFLNYLFIIIYINYPTGSALRRTAQPWFLCINTSCGAIIEQTKYLPNRCYFDQPFRKPISKLIRSIIRIYPHYNIIILRSGKKLTPTNRS